VFFFFILFLALVKFNSCVNILCRRIPFTVALKNKHRACAALLDPSSAAPLVWPSPLKFISELNQEAKALLENALLEANREREKALLKENDIPSSPLRSDSKYDDIVSDSEVQRLPLIFWIIGSSQC
jgi:hypothetical protein